ncbi:MAG: sensor histidine kinase [Dyadobacter sp.]|uniref:sensor histidine kinase n=1 Tax=Dyadobacter sp. TaxID=1914288 RepID=UPI003263E090
MRTTVSFVAAFIFLINELNGQSLFPELKLDPAGIRKAQNMESKALAANDSFLLGKALFLYGDTYRKVGNFSRANEYFLKAIRALKTGNESYELAMSYLYLNEGVLISLKSREDYQNACTALDIFSRLKHNSGIALAYNYITSFYKRIWIWNDEELKLTPKIPARSDTIFRCIDAITFHGALAKDTSMMAEAHLQRADYYRHFNDKRAITEFDKAYKLFASKGDDNAVVHTLCHKSAAFLKFQDLPNAIACIELAERLISLKESGDYWTSTHFIEVQTEIFEAAKLWKRAYQASRNLSNLYALRRTGDRDNLIQSFYIKEEAEKKEIELVTQKAELGKAKVQRNLTIAIGALLLLAVITTLIFYFLYKKNRQISAKNQDLVREQNHRVKNNLQVIASLLSLQADQLDDGTARRMIDESLLRIESMAILHRRLYDGERLAEVDLADFIPEIIQSVFETLGVKNVNPEYKMSSIFLGADKATPVGLIINELATNACKYAFPHSDHPEFSISCMEIGQDIELTVSDNGPGMSGVNMSVPLKSLLKTNESTFGMPLIQSQIIQLNGKGRFIVESEGLGGTSFRLAFKR